MKARRLGKVCTPLEGSGVRLQCGAALGGLRMPKERKPKEPQSMLGVPPWHSFVEVGDDVTLGVLGFWISGQHTRLCWYFLTVLRYDRVYDSRDSPVFEILRICVKFSPTIRFTRLEMCFSDVSTTAIYIMVD